MIVCRKCAGGVSLRVVKNDVVCYSLTDLFSEFQQLQVTQRQALQNQSIKTKNQHNATGMR
jgi:hypothetical protein